MRALPLHLYIPQSFPFHPASPKPFTTTPHPHITHFLVALARVRLISAALALAGSRMAMFSLCCC